MQVLAHGQKFHFEGNADLYQILIKPDFTAEASFCPDGNDKKCNKEKLKGDWQNYYDQAIQVNLDTGISFLANFKYELKSNYSKDLPKLNKTNLAKMEAFLKKEQKNAFDSVCNSTMVGFV